MVSLIAAGFWCLIGAGLLVWQALHPGNPFLVIRGTQVSFGWLALAFAGYNLVRWWGSRSANLRRRDPEQVSRPPGVQKPPREASDPQFDFSDQPPQAP
jgi:hypothetical protein